MYSAVACGDVRPRKLALRSEGRVTLLGRGDAAPFVIDAPVGPRAPGDFRMCVRAAGDAGARRATALE